MEREILFRGKRVDNGEWCYFSLSDAVNNGADDANQIFNFIQSDVSTVCQYTGLTDKNGNKIYEGDIVRFHGNEKDIAKIVFGEFCVVDMETPNKIDRVIGWHYEVIPTDAISECEPFCYPMPLTEEYINTCELDVIGNISDNPELLGKGGAE